VESFKAGFEKRSEEVGTIKEWADMAKEEGDRLKKGPKEVRIDAIDASADHPADGYYRYWP
jgi:hypothetical protein